MTRSTAFALGLALWGCGSAQVPAPARAPAETAVQQEAVQKGVGTTRAPTPAEERELALLMREAEQIRNLTFVAPVSVYVKDRAAMRAYVAEAIDDGDLARSRRRYQALGLIVEDLDVRELVESLLEDELIGYYDPDSRSLAVRDDLLSSPAAPAALADDQGWRATVLHELVHALQDQHLGLSALMKADHSTDHANGLAAVVEGDATLAMWVYLAEQAGSGLSDVLSDLPRLARALQRPADAEASELARAPAIVRAPLLFRYREGTLFAAGIVRAFGLAGLDQVYRRRAPSTWQVSDVRRYLEPAPAAHVRVSAPPALSAAGYTMVDEDSLGALEIAAALSESERSPGEGIMDSWRADRYTVWQRRTQLVSVWCVLWGSPAAAERARDAFRALGVGRTQRAVQRDGSLVLVTHGLPIGAAAGTELCEARWPSSEQVQP